MLRPIHVNSFRTGCEFQGELGKSQDAAGPSTVYYQLYSELPAGKLSPGLRGVSLVDQTVNARLATINRRKIKAQLLHYALKPFGHLEFSEIYRLELEPLPKARPLDGYEISHAMDSDIDQIARELVRDEPAYVIRNLWSQGHHCFVAKRDGRVVAYDWIGFSTLQEEEFTIALQPQHAFCLNAYTHPDHRGRGVHYELLRNLLVFAAANGKTRAYTLVSLFNRDSWKSHIRMGWQHDFTYCYFRPYFVPGRLPWAFTAPRYPARLNWQQHSWLYPSNPPAGAH